MLSSAVTGSGCADALYWSDGACSQTRSGRWWMCTPRNLVLWTISTAAPSMRRGVWVGWFLLKSTMISCVLLTFRSRLFSLHQSTRCFTSSLFASSSLPQIRPNIHKYPNVSKYLSKYCNGVVTLSLDVKNLRFAGKCGNTIRFIFKAVKAAIFRFY